jgi:hypothetical protein
MRPDDGADGSVVHQEGPVALLAVEALHVALAKSGKGGVPSI